MMRETACSDMRVKRTLENIDSAFMKLVLEKGYTQVTVTTLCEEARIGRKTFYSYFDSLDELLEHTLEKLTRQYIQRLKYFKVPDDIREITREFYIFSIEQGRFYDNLVCSEASQTIGRDLLLRFVRETWSSSSWFSALSVEEQDILICFIYNTGAGLYRQWVMGGKKIPLEKMISFADNLLARGIEGFRNIVN